MAGFLIKNYEVDEAKTTTTKAQIRELATTIEDFRRVCSFYPTADQGLDALVKAPGGRECKNYDPQGFIKKVPLDAWDNPFIYINDGNKYLIKSLGGDGKEGGEGVNKDLDSDNI